MYSECSILTFSVEHQSIQFKILETVVADVAELNCHSNENDFLYTSIGIRGEL